MDKTKNVAIRKRQQIESANKVMFTWVAAAAVIVGVASVVSVSLYERLTFNQKVINEINTTVGVLRENNSVVEDLKDNVRLRNTDQALLSTPRIGSAQPISVVLDALPSNPNSSALGASLQQKLLQVNGLTIESLTVDPIAGVEDSGDGATDESSSITFKFVVSASANNTAAITSVLDNIERSIRPIDITTLSVERQSDRITLSADGRSFYLPEKKVELKTKEIKP